MPTEKAASDYLLCKCGHLAYRGEFLIRGNGIDPICPKCGKTGARVVYQDELCVKCGETLSIPQEGYCQSCLDIKTRLEALGYPS